jgi:DNA-binding transcriptional LysR family regulator
VLETREVEAFLAVAEELHFGRAAARLRVTPSRVSQTIRALERRVGGGLFERTSRAVRLTPLGEQLLAEWRPAYQRLDRGLRDARHVAAGRPEALHVGFSPTLLPGMREALVEAYQSARPGVQILPVAVSILDIFGWRPRPVDDDLDVVVSWLPQCRSGPLNAFLRCGPPMRREKAGLLVPPDHPLAGRSTVDIEEVADYPVLMHDVVADSGIEWVPAATPAGRPITRVRRSHRHLESLGRGLADGKLVHITAVRLAEVILPWAVDGATVIPLTGHPPLSCRAIWPLTGGHPNAEQFARICADAGEALGWLQTPDEPQPTVVGQSR